MKDSLGKDAHLNAIVYMVRAISTMACVPVVAMLDGMVKDATFVSLIVA